MLKNFFAAASRVQGLRGHPSLNCFVAVSNKYLTMKTLRQHFEYLAEREYGTAEDDFDPDEYLQSRYGDADDTTSSSITEPSSPDATADQFNRLGKTSGEFDFRKGIVEPEPEEWEPDVKIGKPVEPYDRESEFLAAFDQPQQDNRFTAPAGWRYVEKDEDPARYGTAPAGNGLPDLKYDPQSRTLKAAGAPALDLSEPKARYKFNRFSQQQEPVDSEPDDSKATEVKTSTWRDIYRLNRKTIGPDPRLIRPGQVLKMPNGAPDYTVQKGDTLIRIAAQDSTAAPFTPPKRPVSATPDNKDSQPRRVRTPTPVQRPSATITPTPGNISPRQTAATGLNFPPSSDFALAPGEQLVVPKKLQAERDKLSKDTMAQAIRQGAEREAARQQNQAAKRSMKEGSWNHIKHLRDYIVEVETAPAFTPNQTMDPQQAAAANKAAQDFVAQLTAKVKTWAQTQSDVLKTVTAKPVSAPAQPAPVQEAQLNEGLFDGIVSWVKDALAKNPLIDIALRLIPSPAQAILAAIDVIDAVKSGSLADAAKSLAGMVPGGQQVAQAIGVGQAAASGDATSVATGLASAALPKIGEASELDRILAIARHPR